VAKSIEYKGCKRANFESKSNEERKNIKGHLVTQPIKPSTKQTNQIFALRSTSSPGTAGRWVQAQARRRTQPIGKNQLI
jgi:hypothetical protein